MFSSFRNITERLSAAGRTLGGYASTTRDAIRSEAKLAVETAKAVQMCIKDGVKNNVPLAIFSVSYSVYATYSMMNELCAPSDPCATSPITVGIAYSVGNCFMGLGVGAASKYAYKNCIAPAAEYTYDACVVPAVNRARQTAYQVRQGAYQSAIDLKDYAKWAQRHPCEASADVLKLVSNYTVNNVSLCFTILMAHSPQAAVGASATLAYRFYKNTHQSRQERDERREVSTSFLNSVEDTSLAVEGDFNERRMWIS